MKQSPTCNSESALTFPDPFFSCQDLLLCNSSPETFKIQTIMLVFTQGLKITVEGITDHSPIPKPREGPFPLSWDVFAASFQNELVCSMSVQVLWKAYVKMELEV